MSKSKMTYDQAVLKKIEKWAEKGLSYSEISSRLGISNSTFRNHRKKLKIINEIINNARLSIKAAELSSGKGESYAMQKKKIDSLKHVVIESKKDKYKEYSLIIDDIYSPFPLQRTIHNCQARFRIVAAGRRFGKTTMAVVESIIQALQEQNQVVWWVAPSYAQSMKGWRLLRKFLPKDTVTRSNRTERFKELVNGSTIWIKSAERPELLEGEGIHFLVIDEAALIKEGDRVWQEALRPALSDTMGRALIISRPFGRNWFYREFMRGKVEKNRQESPEHPDYVSFHCRTYDNPHIPEKEIKAAARQLPEKIFRIQYEAEFVSDAGLVFQNLSNVFRTELALSEPNIEIKAKLELNRYVHGMDLGKDNDYTVIVTFDTESRKMVSFRRWRSYEWMAQARMAAEYMAAYPGLTVFDATTYGYVFLPLLNRQLQELNAQISVIGFWITGGHTPQLGVKHSVEGRIFTISKEKLIQDLIVATENKSFEIPDCQETGWLKDEMGIFDYSIRPGGLISYNAPSGCHDDGVIALALVMQELGTTKLYNSLNLELYDFNEEVPILIDNW